MKPTLAPVLLAIQCSAFANAVAQHFPQGQQQHQHAIATDQPGHEETAPDPAVEDITITNRLRWTPQQNGWEDVDAAYAELRKIKPALSRRSKRHSGMFSTILQYMRSALPTLRMSGPPQEHLAAPMSGPLVHAVNLLQRSASLNNTDAIYLLGQFNFFGNYSHPRNFEVAFEHYARLASFGNSSAQYMVGLMYATGLGDVVERDQAKALLYHRFAAEDQHTRSEMTMAARYHNGIGVPKNCEMAAKYYKRVADKSMAWFRSGPPGGMSTVHEAHRLSDDVGGVYGEGASVISSGIHALKASVNSDARAAIDDVIEYLDIMSQKGDFKSSYNIGRLYYEGQRGLDRNVELARRYFLTVTTKYWRAKDGRVVDQPKPSLDKYASKAAGYIGRMWLRGEGSKQDFRTAAKWFERGIKHGDAQSQWGMGYIYLHGLDVTKNVHRAAEYFKAAAEQDFSLAQVAMGALHLDLGQPEDLKIANQYFEAANRWNNMEAQYYLAEMMHHGIGRDKTCNVAVSYYKNVAEKAEPLVSSWLEANQAYEDGDYELALIDYVMAAEQGYERAQNNVAWMLDETQSRLPLPAWLHRPAPKSSILQNPALALIYWTRSAIQNNIDSLVKMGDYYLNGIGTEVALDKASQCYTGASEYYQSAQALYNLGWMHENGVGLTQDYHLAKRYYDQALETNEEAYLPVTLSLLKLRARSAWNTLTNGRINSIQDEPVVQKEWSLGEWIANFLQEDDYYYDDVDDDEYYYEDTITGSDGEPMRDDFGDEGVLESVIILGLVAAIGALMYYRAQRQQAHQRQQEEAARQGGQVQAAAQAGQAGGFVAPGAGGPGEFAGWAAGGVGL
ncbi:ER membrane protein [Microdochium trichocladiopsis]|uniref:ER membrane protein n=1 Tax=Microdochium trichocladiopsis TaxID=1682393 RepID=A0A9P8XUY4_9PEZI|nr:ER membrane protein [Microdochium trichocladiopsis]KAH7018370.1 ER membrane protein [Microdochium trichocladiopsis]